ncbi:hypothetical protein SS1G_10689 [Sclerotinia sclerotiorum 1980 UF-70]|uniref:HTH CENPB-type domain-containing protein n=1 Tax=Sclerotinia sclerotiorum (strain ATCC 18683 / 1980 / Ss-1) TaxID=665079 RepID=A7EZC2_SCLS1|nr:hypothetical protein SS1G_10689 [Sclerotinia sclerotiorum 1980 UF-70]EDN94814.1 hypothetical protein SS1G_10689 [Sclerotinia sclerotiorum 1980 UF-70]
MADEIRIRYVQVASSPNPTSTNIPPIDHEWIYRFQKRHPELKKSNWKITISKQEWIIVFEYISPIEKALSPMIIFKAQNTNIIWIPKDAFQD